MRSNNSGWGLIIFLLICFWPVGLFLMIRKLNTDRSAIMSPKTGSLTVVAWILIGIGVIGIPGAKSGGAVIVFLVFIAGGILILRKVSQIKKTAKKYKKYIDIVVNQKIMDINYVASAVSLSYEAVAKDLQEMIDIGYLRDAFIHQGNRQIVLKQHENVTSDQGTVVRHTPIQKAAVNCTGCGANIVVVVGEATECEYCGTPIIARA